MKFSELAIGQQFGRKIGKKIETAKKITSRNYEWVTGPLVGEQHKGNDNMIMHAVGADLASDKERKKEKRKKIRDLMGLKLGMLTVVRFAEIRNGNTYWVCLCDCGKEIEVQRSHLLDKKREHWINSCGCKKVREKTIKVDKYSNFHQLMSKYMFGAKRRGIEWNLSIEESFPLFSSDCYYCGSPPRNCGDFLRTQPSFFYNGIDRLDSHKGYFLENCVSCCSRCNLMKGSMHVDDFLEFIRTVHEYRIKQQEK